MIKPPKNRQKRQKKRNEQLFSDKMAKKMAEIVRGFRAKFFEWYQNDVKT